MSDQQILYEAKLSRMGRKRTSVVLVKLSVWFGLVVVLWFHYLSFPESIVPVAGLALCAVGLAKESLHVYTLRNNPGFYRISIDQDGLYIHSDDIDSALPFTIEAHDVHRLVRTTTSHSEGTDHEYYIDTKSGTRHRIDQFFADHDMDVMRVFEKIADRFPWAQVLQEDK